MKITLRLNNIRDLFIAPECDPFDSRAVERSGMDIIVDMLKPTGLNQPLETVLVLPATQIEDGVVARIEAAVERYCQARIDESRNELASLRWQGLKSLQTGVIFLALCLLLSAAADGAEFLPPTIRALAAESFIIAGWVSMWHPAELLLYAWWPYWRQIRVYRHIMAMQTVIEPEMIAESA